tara:strand:+ start:1735 stop:2094 length:360 start_codon:yes stop_codon:yes gene_type:complete
MSYSRWGTSFWYTFRAAKAGKKTNMLDEVFAICDIAQDIEFTYLEIKGNINGCLWAVKEQYAMAHESEEWTNVTRDKKGKLHIEYGDAIYPGVDVTPHLEELKGYMEQFIKDVEEDYTQ